MLLAMMMNPAMALDHELYTGSHVDVQVAERQVGVGLTGLLGYRLHTRRFTVGVAASLGALRNPVTAVELEAGLHLRPKAGTYKPWIGVEAVGRLAGHDVRGLVTGIQPGDLRLAIRPLAFHAGIVSISALELSYGGGSRDGAWHRGAGLNLVNVGVLL